MKLPKLRFFRHRSAFDESLDEELRLHLEEHADDLVRQGVPREEALRRARAAFGSPARAAEDTRREWQFPWLEDLLADLRYAARALRREPLFLTVAVLSLALGIGCNTAIFSLAMEALVSAPSVHDSSTLVRARLGGNSHVNLRPLTYLQNLNVMPIAGTREGEVNWRHGDEAQRVFAMRVTPNFFDVVGVPVQLGRGFRPGEARSVVLSYRFWQAKLHADPAILGHALILDGEPYIVTGVLPADHRTLSGMGFAPALYVPVSAGANINLQLFLRHPAGLALSAVRERIVHLGRQLDQVMPEKDFKFADEVRVNPVAGLHLLNDLQSVAVFFGVLLAVVSLLLGIACLNVSGLLLARASTRVQEFAIRTSLGAGRGRLIRLLLAESFLLAGAGVVAGLLLNVLLTRLISQIDLGLPVPVAFNLEPDWRLLSYTSLIGLISALLIGVLPAWRTSRGDTAEALKQDQRQTGSRLTLRRLLVIAQVAASIIVLTTAALFARNLFAAVHLHPGFDLDRTVYVSLRLVPESYPTVESRQAITERARLLIETVPGVASTAAASMIPFNDDATHGGMLRTTLSKDKIRVPHYYSRVGPGYFRTLGIPLLAGREFTPQGIDEVIVNESFARRVFGVHSPIGESIIFDDHRRTVVGVVRDSKYAWMNDHQRPAVFERYEMSASGNRASMLVFMVRAGVDPDSLVRPLRQAMLSLDSSAAVEVKPLAQAMGLALLPSRVGAGLLGIMGLLGLLLTTIGLYGLMAYSVTRRIREIGLRVALGANPGRIRRLIFGEGAWLIGTGLALGLVAALFLTRPLAEFLVETISTTDPLTYALVSLVMLAAGLLACAIPARRALRIDPMVALRYE